MRDRREPNAAQNHNRKRQTVLLTGASGVVGQALLERLSDVNIICLVHNTAIPDPGIVSIRGDITQSRLGLAAAAYRELAEGVDAVIHCAAVTDFYKADGSLEATNIDGTVNVAKFALAADAVMYHVSTAFRDAQAVGSRGRKACCLRRRRNGPARTQCGPVVSATSSCGRQL